MFLVFLIVSCSVALSTLGGCSDVVEKSEEREVRGSRYCSATILNTTGVITSPNYPYNYYNNLDCKYTFIPPVSGYYTMRFYMCYFNVEDSYFSNCGADYVEFGDGTKFCGKKTGSTRQSSSTIGSYYLDFHSDYSISEKGFKIAYCANCSNWSSLKALCSGSRTTSGPSGRSTTSRYRTTTGRRFTYPF